MPIRKYHVTHRILIDGEHLPGDTVELDDRALGGDLLDKIEALDASAHMVLGIARLRQSAPASATDFAGADDQNWGPVLDALARGADPPGKDLGRLLRDSYPPPVSVCEYLAALLTGRRRPKRRPNKLPSFRGTMTEALELRGLRDQLDDLRRKDHLSQQDRALKEDALVDEVAKKLERTPHVVRKLLRRYRSRPRS